MLGLGVSVCCADNKDFGLVAVLQGRVPKAVTDLAQTRDHKSSDLGPDRVVDGSFGKAVDHPLCFLLDFTKIESVKIAWKVCGR